MPTLNWIGKEAVVNHHLQVPFHLLKDVPSLACGDPGSGNLIVQGDNLIALKALLPYYAGQVKCIYIDPPYNTGNEKWSYNDNVNSPIIRDWLGKVVGGEGETLDRHDRWLCMMYPRLALLKQLLSEDGAIFISIDDNEIHNLRYLMDDIFGEQNFVACIEWQKIYTVKNSAKYLSEMHDHILFYAKKKSRFSRNLRPRDEETDEDYDNPDNDERGPWISNALQSRNYYSKGTYKIECPGGRIIDGPPTGTYWRVAESKFWKLDKDHRVWWGKDKNGIPRIKKFLSEAKNGVVPITWWTYQFAGSNPTAKTQLRDIIQGEDLFITPKPIDLIQRILEIASDRDSLILDSFAGSGTVGHAVTDLNSRDNGCRRFILVEMEPKIAREVTAERVRRVAEGYLRPIMLLQAERVVACEPLRERLTKEFGIAKNEVIISVGSLDELKDVKDITSPKCPVRFIITVQKLREGWDCPFAYVLCSLRETRSATAIEQIVGRILRLPNAQKKQHPDLDCAFAFSVSDSMPEVLNELREALENNGFTAAEADRIIIPVPQGTLPLGLQPQTVQFAQGEEIDEAIAHAQVTVLAGKVKIDAAQGTITVLVPLDKNETEKLQSCVKTPEAKAKIAEIVEMIRAAEMAFGGTGQTRMPTAYERQLDFLVPLLCVNENGKLFEFEKTFLLEQPWRLSTKDANLSDHYNPHLRPAGMSGVVDIGTKGEVQTEILQETPDNDFVFTLHQQVLQLGGHSDWTMESLADWLDRHIEHRDIPADESGAFLHNVIRGLMTKYDIADVGELALDRFRLRDQIATRIQQHRDSEQKAAFQQFLLPESALVVDEGHAINFKAITYEPSWVYEGGFQFKKHYFGPKPGELAEKRSDGKLTEEFQCAQFIDGLPEVEFWVRNLARKATSFRLHTSKDWFYPDFICKLGDGRVLAVEYKGKHLWADAEDKRVIGAVWAGRSKGRCLFVMPTEGDFAAISQVVKA